MCDPDKLKTSPHACQLALTFLVPVSAPQLESQLLMPTEHAGAESAVSPGQGEGAMQDERKQPLPSLTPHRKPANRTAAVRSTWSHPASVSTACLPFRPPPALAVK